MSNQLQANARKPTGRGSPATSETHLLAVSRLLGRKWIPVIVYHLLDEEPMGFTALQSRIDTISSKVLSDNLSELEEAGLLTREIVQERPVRVEYALTPAGEALRPLIEAMHEWGEPNVALAEP